MRLICPHTDLLTLQLSSALTYNLSIHPQKHTTVRCRSFSFTALLYQIPTHPFKSNPSEISVSPALLITTRSSPYMIITRQLQTFIMFLFNCTKQRDSGSQGLSVQSKEPRSPHYCCFFHMCLVEFNTFLVHCCFWLML